jgi:hypothetical protein
MPTDTTTLVTGGITETVSGSISAVMSGATTLTGTNVVSGEVAHTHTYQHEGPSYPDSLEIGTPSKGGCIKVFGDLDDPTTFEERLRAGLALRQLAIDLIANPEV